MVQQKTAENTNDEECDQGKVLRKMEKKKRET